MENIFFKTKPSGLNRGSGEEAAEADGRGAGGAPARSAHAAERWTSTRRRSLSRGVREPVEKKSGILEFWNS